MGRQPVGQHAHPPQLHWQDYTQIHIYRKVFDPLPTARMRAFLHCLREYECQTERDDAKRYGLLSHPLPNGNRTFNTFRVHPWNTVPAHIRGTATAAGAYQIVHTTWAYLFNQGLIHLHPNEDMFSPVVQDRLAVILLESLDALPLIRTGDIDAAISKLLTTWTSLPGAKENGNRRTAEGKPMDMAYFMSLYNRYLSEEIRNGN